MTNVEPFPGTDAETFIQWKGTDVCMDFYCPCGVGHAHVDGYFANFIQCQKCGTVYEMGTQVLARRIDKNAKDVKAVMAYAT